MQPPPRRHKNTRTLPSSVFYHAPSLCATRDAQAHSERQRACASEPKSRRKVHDESVHETKLPKDPVIVVGGGELVARELAAREHHPAAETTAAPSPSRSDRGRTWSTKQLLRVIKIDRVDVELSGGAVFRGRDNGFGPRVKLLYNGACATTAVRWWPERLVYCCRAHIAPVELDKQQFHWVRVYALG